jgi:MATE family multidrug resistance protein
MLRLAIPVVLAELGWMSMGVVDTIMVGPLGPAAIGAAGIGTSLHMAFAIFGMGLFLGLDTFVSQAFGAGRIAECHRWLFHGAALALLLSVPLILACGALYFALPAIGFHGEILVLLQDYYAVIIWSSPLLLLYAALRRYLQGIHHVTPIMFALITANVVNAGANWVLIFGELGFPQMGVAGAAWATILSRLYMLLILAIGILAYDRFTRRDVESMARIDRDWMRRLIRLGLPAASTVTLEVGVFAVATALAGRLDPVSSASHQIALNIAALSFMVPLGVSSAGAVRVGHAIGARDPDRAAAAGWTAILIGLAFMATAASTFFAAPGVLIGFFTSNEAVLSVATSLLFVAAVFQLFDGLQIVATGVLRGVGDTRTPMVTNLASHWCLGLPIGYLLCFRYGYGVYGLWIGLSTGLITAGAILLWLWHRQVVSMRSLLPTRSVDFA